MKKIFVLAALFAGLSLSLAAQDMKRPTIMVIPADVWCNDNGYMTRFDDMGTIRMVPDYQLALQSNYEIRSLIAGLGSIFADRNFPLKNLEAELRRLQKEEAELAVTTSKDSFAMLAESPVDRLRRTAQCDIIIDVAYRWVRNGPNNQVVLTITAIDAYSSLEVAVCPPAVSPNTEATVEQALQCCVTNIENVFMPQILNYFKDMKAKGRNARILLKRWEDAFVDFESEVTYNDQEAELGEVIQVWMNENCVGGQFNLVNATDNTLDFNPARIPVRGTNLAGKEVPIDAAGFVRNLSKWLKSQYGIESRVLPKGLGEAWLVIGGK